MATANALQISGPESVHGNFDGLPPLARERLPGDFDLGDRVLYLFDPAWRDTEPEVVLGEITDISPCDRPFRLGLPLGTMLAVLGEESERLTGKREVNSESFKRESDLPRQIMLESPELRSKTPSTGDVLIRTDVGASVPRIIGISINDYALIPETTLPHLQRDEAYRTAYLLDGGDDLEERTFLEHAIRDWTNEETSKVEARQPSRARAHSRMLSGRIKVDWPTGNI